MDNELPEFASVPVDRALSFARSVFKENLVSVTAEDDGSFRVVFRASHFVLQEGHTEPSKSQWNTLKKQMKRRNRAVFIFKGHEAFPCAGVQPSDERDEEDALCYALRFGYFVYV